MFQMWHEEVFCGFGGGTSVFDSRPHMTTAKALMINTAVPYVFSQQDTPPGEAIPNPDVTRDKQGWGMVDAGNLYDLRDKMFIVNETDILTNLQSVDYAVIVAASEPALRVTLVYADPPGTTSSTQHRINDLTLKVTSPSGTVYWGNDGLLTRNWSASGGSANTIDTVENVFVQNPETGSWTVRVSADEIIENSHVETCTLDADFALVVSGARADCNGNGVADVDDIAQGAGDCNSDCVLDECGPDCNNNGVADECDVVSGAGTDCDSNGVLDECEPDCNGNGVTDACDIASGTSTDCFNGNCIPDECEALPRSACCIGAECVMLTQCACTEQGGTFQGRFSVCEPTTCATE